MRPSRFRKRSSQSSSLDKSSINNPEEDTHIKLNPKKIEKLQETVAKIGSNKHVKNSRFKSLRDKSSIKHSSNDRKLSSKSKVKRTNNLAKRTRRICEESEISSQPMPNQQQIEMSQDEDEHSEYAANKEQEVSVKCSSVGGGEVDYVQDSDLINKKDKANFDNTNDQDMDQQDSLSQSKNQLKVDAKNIGAHPGFYSEHGSQSILAQSQHQVVQNQTAGAKDISNLIGSQALRCESPPKPLSKTHELIQKMNEHTKSLNSKTEEVKKKVN